MAADPEREDTSGRLTLARCREILGPAGESLDDEALRTLRDRIYDLAGDVIEPMWRAETL
jgi:hypothetical protein